MNIKKNVLIIITILIFSLYFCDFFMSSFYEGFEALPNVEPVTYPRKRGEYMVEVQTTPQMTPDIVNLLKDIHTIGNQSNADAQYDNVDTSYMFKN
jgi:hypothetical protein